MTSIRTRAKLALAVLAIAAAPAGAAFAGEGNGPSFPGDQIPNVVVGAPATPNLTTNDSRILLYSISRRAVEIGGTLPPTSNGQGEPEPINSLPPGAEDGTPALQHRQALERYWADQAAAPAQHLAAD